MSILLGSATILRLFCRSGPHFQWKSLSRTRSIVKSIERRGGAKLRLGLVFLRQLLVTWQVSSDQTNHVTESISAVPPLGPICPKQITTDYVRLALLGGNDPEEVLSTSIHVIFCSLLNKELTLSLTKSFHLFTGFHLNLSHILLTSKKIFSRGNDGHYEKERGS